MPFPSSSKAFARSNCDLPDITRNWFHQSKLKLRYRTDYDADGFGIHPNITSFTMHEEAHAKAGLVIRDLHNLGVNYARTEIPWSYQWTGLAGAKVCKPGYHRYGAAIDFTRFDWGSLVAGADADFRLDVNRTDFQLPNVRLSINQRPLWGTRSGVAGESSRGQTR